MYSTSCDFSLSILLLIGRMFTAASTAKLKNVDFVLYVLQTKSTLGVSTCRHINCCSVSTEPLADLHQNSNAGIQQSIGTLCMHKI